MRSVIDYAAPVFHHALPAYLSQELERIQKRAMRIICPGIEYQQALELTSLTTVAEHHHNICTRTFKCIMSDPNHKLRKLLPPVHKSNYNLRHARTFTLPRCKTNRFKNSFFYAPFPPSRGDTPHCCLAWALFTGLLSNTSTDWANMAMGNGQSAFIHTSNFLKQCLVENI